MVLTVLGGSRHSRAARFRSITAALSVALTRRLHRFFNAQARRVLARYLSEFQVFDEVAPQPPRAEELLPDVERTELWLAALPFILQVSLNAAELAGALVGLGPIDETNPRTQTLLTEARTHLSGAHDTTLDAIRATLAEGFLHGLTALEIAHGVPEMGYRGLAQTVASVYAGRSRTIAQTETTHARQMAALERYQDASIALVYVADGADCGWTEHTDPDGADGSVRTLIEARGCALSHPNCARVFLPVR